MLQAQDILNYYAANKPFEITDDTQYLEMLTSVSDFTLLEISENDPIISEKRVTTSDSKDDYITMNLYSDIDESFMGFIVFTPVDQLVSITGHVLSYYMNAPEDQTAISQAIKSNTLLDFLSVRDALYSMEEWFHLNKTKIIYDGTNIKVLPSTEYYCLYKRYRSLDEIPPPLLDPFKKLFGINLYLSIYGSDIFVSESGIRSVSISGLAISFNVSTPKAVVESLSKEKQKIMSELALIYDKDTIGLI